MTTPTSRFPPLTLTNTPAGNIVDWAKAGNVVALYTTTGMVRVFHSINFKRPESPSSLKDVRVIYVNCNSSPGLLMYGELEREIKNSNPAGKELALDHRITQTIIEHSLVPNREYVEIRIPGRL